MPLNKKLVREYLLTDVRPWKGELYHGSPLAGIACVLESGFSAICSHDIEVCLMSTSKNPKVLNLFGRDDVDGEHYAANGFRFRVDFRKVLVIPTFWYVWLYANSEFSADSWEDEVGDQPELAKLAEAFGLMGERISNEKFFDEFVPKDIEAIMFPGFHLAGDRAEAEMAITETGVKKLKKFTDAILIDYVEYGWKDAKQALKALGVKPDDCHG